MDTPNWPLLAEPFPASDIEWRPLTVSRKTGKGLAAAYLTARAVAQRLDDVFGPGGWKNEYRDAPGGGIICRIYFRGDDGPGGEPGEWIWREDGADRTDVEPTKGGLSAAFKRAGAALGIGRYLYDLPQQWVEVDEYGKFKTEPRIPARFLPPDAPGRVEARPVVPSARRLAPATGAGESPARVLYREHAEPQGVAPEQFKSMLDEAKKTHATEEAALDAVRAALVQMGNDPLLDAMLSTAKPGEEAKPFSS